ncbi:hypothetical protein DFA_03271 [Cavenderia fasciculata]|uniref:Uncharacterized protein n=1 Tax=Cavenderia fasciculata TaxID=261658 RepID=F4PH41_CACFS|nr:uncharacterized protein DFA_03271 [Cavenderia fasciculata]EGG25025.1 hypothetical protein DFA_03271 [Cavenderia fasciculata]|eukprot:XP_004362876.1 hypothetical protein DFA_03271 [Cavenderia fasciculata]
MYARQSNTDRSTQRQPATQVYVRHGDRVTLDRAHLDGTVSIDKDKLFFCLVVARLQPPHYCMA